MRRRCSPRAISLLAVVLAIGAATPLPAAELSGELRQWHTVTLTFRGPASDEQATPNPFTTYRLTVELRHLETGTRYTVPGFFAADGRAADSSATRGDRWRARFSPSHVGRWSYAARLVRGEGAALDAPAQAVAEQALREPEGHFDVAPSDKPPDDLRHHGHLRYVGERYLRFAGSRRYFLKAGTNSPETLLGYHDFDGTWRDTEEHPVPAPHGLVPLPSLDAGLHRYPGHVADWRAGDPTWQDGKGKGLVGGINYLADQGVNSIAFVTMNVNGDGRNVWPWTGPWRHDRFDVSKLEQWEIVFEHMQRRGLQMHVVLQETENDHLLDAGELGPARKLYLREMVARFAHHPALVWNLGEENLQTPRQQQAMADYIRSLDPYDHPIVVHNDHWSARNLRDTFDPLLGTTALDGTAIQDFNWSDVHAHVKRYVAASRAAGKPWFVCSDELGGASFGLRTDADDPGHFEPRSRGLWGNLMAGGAGVEWYFGWQNNSPHSDLSAESWRTREEMWRQSRIAVDFFQRHLPFAGMKSADELVAAHGAYAFARRGEVYAVYRLGSGSTRLDLETHRGPFSVHWFDPVRGGELQRGSVETVWGPDLVDVGSPPGDEDGEWVVLARRLDPVFEADERGRIVVEAEHFVEQRRDDVRRWHTLEKTGPLPDLEGAGEPAHWVRSLLSAAPRASGFQFLRLLPDTRRSHDDPLREGVNFSPEPGQLAVLSYPVRFPKAGRYYVWVRAFSTGTEDNGLHVGIDGRWPESGRRMQWCEGKSDWRWECAQRTEANHCGEPMQVFLDVDEPGIHTVQFSMREDGFAFDQFLLTTDRDDRPEGPLRGERVRDAVASPTAETREAPPLPARRPGPGPMRFPGEEWERGTPESQSFDRARLALALEYLDGHTGKDGLGELMLVRNGVVLHEGPNTRNAHNVWSCTKSFTSTALGLLVAEGRAGLDTRAATVEPRLERHYPHVTLRHFATMTSGYSAAGRSRWSDENADWSRTPYEPEAPLFAPGTAFAYWDEAMMMFGRVLTRIAGRSLKDYLAEKVFEPIGLGRVEWGPEGELDGVPIVNGCTNVHVDARQLARFGHLFLNRGRWNGVQVIPAEWVDAATSVQVPESVPVADTDRRDVLGSGAYGYNWWVNGGALRMPSAPPGTFYASGLNHNVLFVVPEWNLVVVRTGVDGNPAFGKHNVYDGFLERLGAAMLPE